MNTNSIITSLRGKLVFSEELPNDEQIKRLYRGTLSELKKIDDFETCLQIAVPCFDYLRMHLENLGFNLGLSTAIGSRGGWYQLWLHWEHPQAKMPIWHLRCVHLGDCTRDIRSVRDRQEAASKLLGITHRSWVRGSPTVTFHGRLPWVDDWTYQHLRNGLPVF